MSKLMFISDLDGTLLSHGTTICEQSLEAIRNEKDNVTFCVATGRHIGEVTKTLALQKDAKYIITSNGNEIYEVENGDTLKKIYTGATITTEIAEKALAIAKKYKAYHIISTSDTYYCENKDATMVEEEKQFGIYHEEIDSILNYIKENKDAVLKIIFFIKSDELKALYNELVEKIGEVADVTTSSAVSIEINMKGVSKGSAISFLKNHLQEEELVMACVGDNGNDISMIEPCHYSFAMEKGIDELKNKANEIVPTVGHAFRRFVQLHSK
ncbi:MAG: Cof-type HAD-IIB family hydrolase [Bacillaceae bacterium]